ncbi:PREDICTED: uncharacterized protein LOC108567629 isoform X2 [Nicrophorus vespilloides]|nr:PREDICTED: uncharacterized protein LOC108567629 isoform X2 [Nicrophorus vespilloides]XP_017783707.1 PREDICTED: uncharacterized protein LOC108567629 isoform X2 [Nicrophorus vespilloides]
MNAQKIIILAAYFLTALIAVTATKGYYHNDKRANDRPFMMGMRYGRADKAAKTAGKHVIVAPRNDKFFLASRYGKRSGGEMISNAAQAALVFPVPPICGSDEDLKCTYSGISNIYRCIQSYRKDSAQGNGIMTTSI